MSASQFIKTRAYPGGKLIGKNTPHTMSTSQVKQLTLDITDLHIYHGNSLEGAGDASCSNIISILEQDIQCLFLMYKDYMD